MIEKAEKNINGIAVIHIGADSIKMKVSHVKNRKVSDLDNLESVINLAQEVFTNKKIGFESIKNIEKILEGYLTVLKEYGINDYKVIASTFMLEADNIDYVIQQLKIRNDIELEIMEENQENSLIYYEIIDENHEKNELKKPMILSHIGVSDIGIALYDGDNIVFNQNLPIGPLKLYKLLGSLHNETNDFYEIVEDYIEKNFEKIKLLPFKNTIKEIVISGMQVNLLKNFCCNEISKNFELYKIKFNNFYDEIKNMSSQSISDKYNVTLHDSDLLFITAAICKNILNFAPDVTAILLNVEPLNTSITKELMKKTKKNYDDHIKNSALACSKVLCKNYGCDENHVESILKNISLIFDRLKNIAKLTDRDKLLLEISAILHEIGYFVDIKNPSKNASDIIKNLEIYGLTKEEILIISNVVKYDEFNFPGDYDEDYKKMSKQNKMIVSKLVAIFKISDALDKSKKQKIKSLKIKSLEDSLLITGETDDIIYLEKWAFSKCVPFFEDVFGIKLKLTVKTLLF